MTQEEINSHYETIIRIIVDKFSKDFVVEPVAFSVSGDGNLGIIPLAFTGGDSKDRAARAIRLLVKKLNTQVFVFASEAWFVQRSIDDPLVNNITPSQCDDRIEVLMIQCESHFGEKLVRFEIKRDKQAPYLVRLPDSAPAAKSAGRFTGFLEKRFDDEQKNL